MKWQPIGTGVNFYHLLSILERSIDVFEAACTTPCRGVADLIGFMELQDVVEGH